MPSGLKRYYGKADLHFITFRCYWRLPLLETMRARELFVQELGRVRDEMGFRLVGYVVMPEHVHLLISEPKQGTPSSVLHKLKLQVSRKMRRGSGYRSAAQSRIQFEEGSEQPRAFWQARFYDFNVWTERKRVEKLRYIHRNPVERGLVSSPEQWRWSSFRCYLCAELGPVRLNDTEIMIMRIRIPAA